MQAAYLRWKRRLRTSQRAGAFLLGTDPFFISTRDQLITLATRYRIPAIYPFREDVLAGGLMSYGSSNRDSYRLVGGYAGRILSGTQTGRPTGAAMPLR
jgi:putative tryptophan/tyrosine transport system substrate-binding protein